MNMRQMLLLCDITYGLFTWSVTKNLRNIREKFVKYSRKICERKIRKKLKFAKNLQKIHEILVKISRISIFCDFFKIFAKFSLIFRKFFATDHVKSL